MIFIAIGPNEISAAAGNYIGVAVQWLFLIGEILFVLFGIVYIFGLITFNVRVIIHEYTKGGRTIIKTTRAKEVKNKLSNTPELVFIDAALGLIYPRKISCPPSECAYSYKSFFTKKAYQLIHKDGLYYPISNVVLGRKYHEQASDGSLVIDDTGKPKEFYSTEGSGLEITRNYDIETAFINRLQQAGERYRNKKPVELVAMYGLMVIVILGSIVIIVYSLKKVGDLFTTLQTLGQPIHEAVKAAVTQKLGPG